MQIKVIRSIFSPTTTMGKMYVDEAFFAYTLEDQDRHLNGDCRKKHRSQTAIDPGNYEVVMTFSNNFKRYLPLLLNVPCFEGIRIHGGNTCEDSLGCILIGEHSNMKDKIWNCASKMNRLLTMLKAVERKEKIWIQVSREQNQV
jgi:hypothetical protein